MIKYCVRKGKKEGHGASSTWQNSCQKMGRQRKDGMGWWKGVLQPSSLASLIAIVMGRVAILRRLKRWVKPGQLILPFSQIGALRGRGNAISQCSTVHFSLIRSLSLTILDQSFLFEDITTFYPLISINLGVYLVVVRCED
jgi:hypothetical protein